MIMTKVTTRRKNPNWVKDRLKAAEDYNRYECAVGFPKGKGLGNPHYSKKSASGKETAGPSILEVAVWNNYGATINHPGGTPYIIKPNGMVEFVGLNVQGAKRLPKTKPHKIVIPARPFMEMATAAIEQEWRRLQAKIMERARRTGKAVNVKAALELAGVMGEDKVKEMIGNGSFEPNAPSTIRKKGSSKPLEGESGALKQAPTHMVREVGI